MRIENGGGRGLCCKSSVFMSLGWLLGAVVGVGTPAALHWCLSFWVNARNSCYVLFANYCTPIL